MLFSVAMLAQTSADDFKARYERQIRMAGADGVGVETILDKWAEMFPDDTRMLEGRYKYYFAKSAESGVVTRDSRRYLGKDPVFSLKDSTGKDVFYFEDNVFIDSLFARSQSSIDRAISLEPEELAFRIDKITALMLYEKESPDMATAELLKLISFHKDSRPEWTYYGTAVDEDTFKQTIQEYCYSLFKTGSAGSYEAFRAVSEAMLKLYPKDTAIMNNLGSYWLVARQNNKQALKWYNKVLKINPKDYNAAKNCVILARKDKNTRLEKKYLPALIGATENEAERESYRVRLNNL